MLSSPSCLPQSTAGLTPEEAAEKPYIASMGIYVFKKSVLTQLLNEKFRTVGTVLL